jgi:hypothetical protein
MQGRVGAADVRSDYWFLIKQPRLGGYFRQGPVPLDADGVFLYDISDWPLNSGPDAVTLAAVPRDVSDGWLREYFRIGTWLPLMDVRPAEGIVFIQQVSL